jgi:hypothetical protein
MAITTKIITRQQIQQYKQISNSIYDDKLNQIILEAQFNDLMPLLGERFFNDILEKVEASSAIYDDLLDGGLYEYQGITYTNYGLRGVLANYAYARYTMFGDVIDNPFGQTQKFNVNESKPIDIGTKKTFYQMNRDIAYNYWLNVYAYLNRTATDYPLWNQCITHQRNTFKISKIGANDSYKRNRFN